MEEKMKNVGEMMTKVGDYCNENDIEYIFAAVSKDGSFINTMNNTITNAVLSKAAEVVSILIHK